MPIPAMTYCITPQKLPFGDRPMARVPRAEARPTAVAHPVPPTRRIIRRSDSHPSAR